MASAPHPHSRPFLAAVRCLGAFAVGLAGVCAAINAQMPSLPVFGIREKLAHLRAHRGEIDTLFIGSSRVYRAFDPVLFDRELAARGLSARSFNFGIDGMRPPESFYLLREILKLRLPLRRVFIELGDIQAKVSAANIGTARYVHWHDLRHTVLVLRHLVGSGETTVARGGQAWVHLACFFSRLSNLGRAQEWLAECLTGPPKAWRAPVPWAGRGGFEPQTTPWPAGERRARFEESVAYLTGAPMVSRPVPVLLAAALRGLVAEVRAAGAEPVLVISPTTIGRENLADLAAAGVDAPVIAFTDPRRHPAVFRADHHCDEEHVNAAGAAEFTRALAEELAALR